MKTPHLFLIYFIAVSGCSHAQRANEQILVNKNGLTVQTRFDVPAGYSRKPVNPHSFAGYLRNLPLKPEGTKARYFNGAETGTDIYAAVVNMDITNRDLQQCADAVMRLRGEYFYSEGKFDSISFTLTNGFVVSYKKWMEGYRVAVKGNSTTWQKTKAASNTYVDFRNYMDFVFQYAGSLSLSKSLHSKSMTEIEAGDVFILGGSPGHAIIVLDVAENNKGKKLFLIAQSYMPAQDTQVLKNLNNSTLSPWYELDTEHELVTPSWVFGSHQLKEW